MYKRHRRPDPHRILSDLLPCIGFTLMLLLCLTADGWVELLL